MRAMAVRILQRICNNDFPKYFKESIAIYNREVQLMKYIMAFMCDQSKVNFIILFIKFGKICPIFFFL